MKKFLGNMIFGGAAFALLVAMTASNAQAQYNNFRGPEPPRPTPMQAPVMRTQPAQVTMPPRQQQHPIVQATAVMPIANHHKPAPVVMPNHHRPVHMPPVKYEPPRHVQPVMPVQPVVIAPPHICPEPQTVIVVQPRPTLLEKLFDKIF